MGIPESWITPEVQVALERPAILIMPGFFWLAVHGALVLATKHPLNTGPLRMLMLEILDRMEEKFEAEGIPQPPESWRGVRPWDPENLAPGRPQE